MEAGWVQMAGAGDGNQLIPKAPGSIPKAPGIGRKVGMNYSGLFIPPGELLDCRVIEWGKKQGSQ